MLNRSIPFCIIICMVKDICRDPLILSKVSDNCSIDDKQIGIDLFDTLKYHLNECVGMAANMIGINKRIIVFYDQKQNEIVLMYNPKIILVKDEYETEEGCLSLPSKRKAKRYRTITVEYDNEKFMHKKRTYHGFTAQIIQHEIDMTNGILI